MRFVVPAGLRARPEVLADRAFLALLYASTRAGELAAVPWPDETKRAFLRSQFDAQTQHYKTHYPGADFLVLEGDTGRLGRLYLHWGAAEVRVIDIALLPQHCGRGIGTELLSAVFAQAREAGLSVTIHVEHFNPALRLYLRLGFERVEDVGAYYLLRWTAPTLSDPSPTT